MFKILLVVLLLICSSNDYYNSYSLIVEAMVLSMNSNAVQSSSISAKTKEIFNRMVNRDIETYSAGGSASLVGLERLDASWNALKSGGWHNTPKEIVHEMYESTSTSTHNQKDEYDFTVCGGTLGIFYAIVLQKYGYRTSIIEQGQITGRAQDWNICRKELQALVRVGIFTESEAEDLIDIEFNPVRVGFKTDSSSPGNGFETYVQDVLNLGIRPDKLIDKVKAKYIQSGGRIIEQAAVDKINIYKDCAEISYKDKTSAQMDEMSVVKSRIVIDAMGNQSPIVKQLRGPVQPDGICIGKSTYLQCNLRHYGHCHLHHRLTQYKYVPFYF